MRGLQTVRVSEHKSSLNDKATVSAHYHYHYHHRAVRNGVNPYELNKTWIKKEEIKP